MEDSTKKIGDLLREKRKEANLTIEQVSEALKLRPTVIEAIEEEQWDKLPPAVFVKGFIRSYAKFLGLDLKEIAELCNEALSSKDQEDLLLETDRPKKKTAIWISFIALITVTLFMLFYSIFLKKKLSPSPKIKRSAVDPINKVLTVYLKRPIEFPVLLEVRAKKKVWLKIRIDRYSPESSILEPGEYICWQVRDKFELLVGNSAAIELWINNSPVNFKEKDGRPIYFSLRKKIKGVGRI